MSATLNSNLECTYIASAIAPTHPYILLGCTYSVHVFAQTHRCPKTTMYYSLSQSNALSITIRCRVSAAL